MKLGVREKNKKGERKKEENYIKKGERGLKNASPWVIIFKKFRELGKKNGKGERKKGENYIKKGERGLKNVSF